MISLISGSESINSNKWFASIEQNTGQPDRGTGLVVEKSSVKPKRPSMYKVLLLNDDYTPMEFVVELLMHIFGMNQSLAQKIMLEVHTKGIGLCGVYPREIAETKVNLILRLAHRENHPLKCTMERE
ncbi:MAG: ATP-dependent Clp protease adapter ClpS [Gammaproteobacteria bacterium]|nr:ATP-dependent Clp protease adapter ClpS [Gammaproteobacteria bacterium]MCY4218411.1 ATP-dependent Clp protease adapter ClpS [Gammaproteobacteria bacterium]MCY4273901.1 ATP-dependent Clp protease adapter ClpS [Gammaproteobacteria bacterium]